MKRPWPPWVLRLSAALLVLSIATVARAGDPYLEWFTLATPHFRVHYHGGLEAVAQRTATAAERAHALIVRDLGSDPDEVTQILLTDDQDGANGSAGVEPYNHIRLFVTAPEDMSALNDYDDWMTVLVNHEHTHVVHLDTISGVPGLINAVLGKTQVPNRSQPRWLIEGLAVAMETAHSSGGRLRSTMFDMQLRVDVLEGRFASLDQIGNDAMRWPSATMWYLYGGRFVEFIRNVYGPDVFSAVIADYGDDIVPWALNRSIYRVTGRTYAELYQAWHEDLQRRYAEQVSEVLRRGRREGTRLTHSGRITYYPRFVPPRCQARGAPEQVLYFRDDAHETAGLYLLPLASRNRATESDRVLLARSFGGGASFLPNCGVVFSSLAWSRRLYLFNDLFFQPPRTRSPRGFERQRQRLTVGERARDPDISPGGHRVVYVTNRDGTTSLRIASIGDGSQWTHDRRLVPSIRFEQVFTPRFSPDGRQVAYSSWSRGGYRDVRLVDVDTGRVSELTHDRAIDQQPTWSPDGRWLYFTSDRTGIANVHALDLMTLELFQVTNVIGGAYMPEVSPDGKTLVYVGYTADGFDLYSMPLDPNRWLPARPPQDTRPPATEVVVNRRWPVEAYNPLPTLRPYAYSLEYGPGTFGQAIRVATQGRDAAQLHSIQGSLTLQTELGGPEFSLGYGYHRLPFGAGVQLSRTARPRTYSLGVRDHAATEWSTAAATWVSFPELREFDSQSLAVAYSVSRFDTDLPVGPDIDPYAEVPIEPFRGFLGTASLSWSYSNVERSFYDISPAKGYQLGASLDVANEATASDATLTSLVGRARGYLTLPWLRHHVLGLAVSGGSAAGSYARGGLFYTGGFVGEGVGDLIGSFLDSDLRQHSFVLRGYERGTIRGSDFLLFNAEYRFPLAYIDRGIGALPAYFRTLSAAAFADYGGAFNRIDLDRPFDSFHLGVGGELWLDLVVGYRIGGTVRIGHAIGTDAQAVKGGQTYVVVASPF